MSNKERAIVQILKKLELDLDSIICIMLILKDNVKNQNLYIEYLKTIDPNTITQTKLIEKADEIYLSI